VNTPWASAIYRGHVRHRRYAPHPHAFRYGMFMLYLDLAELDHVFEGRMLWSVNRRNLAQFRRADYFGDPAVPLDQAVRARVSAAVGRAVLGPIRLLAHLRYYGYCFNPVSFYYCFRPDGVTLDAVLAEITNTPWKERHAYVLDAASATPHGNALHWQFDKAFHVSPFLPMNRRYDWRLQPPGEALRIHMNVCAGEQREFDATLTLEREPITPGNLARCLARFPWMTAKVVAAIHWQAFLIWLRRNPVYDHPKHHASPDDANRPT
jgi:hypothetical protein